MKKAFEQWWDRNLHFWPYREVPSGWWKKAFSAGYRAGVKAERNKQSTAAPYQLSAWLSDERKDI